MIAHSSKEEPSAVAHSSNEEGPHAGSFSEKMITNSSFVKKIFVHQRRHSRPRRNEERFAVTHSSNEDGPHAVPFSDKMIANSAFVKKFRRRHNDRPFLFHCSYHKAIHFPQI
jgi:hypothetical protein